MEGWLQPHAQCVRRRCWWTFADQIGLCGRHRRWESKYWRCIDALFGLHLGCKCPFSGLSLTREGHWAFDGEFGLNYGCRPRRDTFPLYHKGRRRLDWCFRSIHQIARLWWVGVERKRHHRTLPISELANLTNRHFQEIVVARLVEPRLKGHLNRNAIVVVTIG